MSQSDNFRFAALSAVKHEYVPLGVAQHPRFEPVVVADDPDQPDWVHERNEILAGQLGVPYVRDVDRALTEYGADVAVVSSQAERHCDLSVRAADAGLHVVQDKPMSTKVSECDRVVEAVERNNVKFMMWNRNGWRTVRQAADAISRGDIGVPYSVHVDFYFASDAGPPKGSRKPGDPAIDWEEYQRSAHDTGRDGGVGMEPMGELKIEGIYPLAYIRMLMGAEVERVFARATAHFHQVNVDNNVEDLATVTLEMERGLVGSLAIGRIGGAGHPDGAGIKIHVIGSQGAIVANEALPEVGVGYKAGGVPSFSSERVANENDFLLMEDFARAIDTDGDTMLDAKAGRAISATVQAALDSARSGAVEAVS